LKEEYKNKSKEELINELTSLKKKFSSWFDLVDGEKEVNENAFEFILKNISEVIYFYKREGEKRTLQLQGADPEKIFGYSSKEYINMSDKNKLLERIHQNDLQVIKSSVDRLLSDKKPVSFKYRFKPKGEEKYKWILERMYPIIGEKEKDITITGVISDITDTVSSKEELTEQQKELSFILENIDQVIYLNVIENGKMVSKYVSSNFKKFYGFEFSELEEIKNKGKIIERIHPDDVKRIFTNEKIVRERKKSITQYRFLQKNKKEYIWLEEVEFPQKDKDGNIISVIGIVRNITELKEKESLLEKRELRYRNLFERNLAGVYRTRENGEVIECNDSFAKMLGYKKAKELIGKDVKRHYLKNTDREDYLKNLQQEGFKTNIKHQLVRKDGKVIWVLVNSSFIKNEEEEPFLEGTLIDITETVKYEQTISKREKSYRQLIENSPYGIIIHKRGKVLYANKRAAEILNYKSANEIINKNGYDFIKKEQLEIAKKMYPDLAKVSDVEHIEMKVKDANGKLLEVELKPVLCDWEGEKAVQVSFRDISFKKQLEEEKVRSKIIEASNKLLKKEITERKKIERKLFENERYTRSIIDSSIDMICSTNKDGYIVEYNQTAEKIFGYSSQEIIGKHANILYANKEEREKVSKRLKETGFFKGEVENVKKNGEKFVSYLTASFIYDEGKNIVGSMGISRDITEEIKQKKELESSLREKEVLLQEVHHRVKNNLQIISSILNLQSSYISDKKILNILKESQNRIKSMSYIHENLYQTNDFSKVNFGEYIRNLSSNLLLTYLQPGKKVNLKIDVEDVFFNLDLAIPCGLIINELLTNALKYAFPSKKSGDIEIVMKKSGQDILLSIGDNGVGMDEKIDIEKTETLGLQLVSSLASQIDAKIKVELKKGTKFMIEFKLYE
jgi:PAS domain S-box-containing protein